MKIFLVNYKIVMVKTVIDFCDTHQCLVFVKIVTSLRHVSDITKMFDSDCTVCAQFAKSLNLFDSSRWRDRLLRTFPFKTGLWAPKGHDFENIFPYFPYILTHTTFRCFNYPIRSIYDDVKKNKCTSCKLLYIVT